MTDATTRLYPEEGCVLVIGGSGGVGAEICRVLARDGCDVALTYFSKEAKAQAAAEGVRAEGRKATIYGINIEVPEAVAKLVADVAEHAGGIHTLVYAAGPLVPLIHLSKVEPALMRKHLLQDTLGFFNVVHYAIPHLRKARGSVVAVQSSAQFRYASADGLSVVPKSGVNGIMKAVAKEEGRYGVRANGVALGIIDAGSHPALMEAGYIDQKYIDAAATNVPLKMWGKPVDVAEAVTYLASRRGRFVSGQVINVDGGYHV
ncbi:SDR family oxidoreductase [Aquamicrobium sp. LC103]|uniref:SDR family NAD(P)-dependent oxidoreductase n=1 Tax=Aquamicrobium sp. LC103 TaxID=1120658 RepID=UPI00063EA847|nr:SDR family oxidoreductase [Aquamicrobium sp. LC103]TKT75741.1 SDR family oxidoreductase [Aquamicrobium sp. LC103]